MKKIVFALLLLFTGLCYAQEQPVSEFDHAADSIYLKCLYEHRSFVSLNTLQFIVGTANLNYEFMLTKRAALKVGGGTILGYRILTEEHIIVDKNARYFIVEPRYYTFNSTMNCWMQVAIASSYKYWNYVQKIPKEEKDSETGKTLYDLKDVTSNMGGVSVIGKHPVTGGFTFEYQLGLDVGLISDDMYVSPNLGFSMGWTF